MAGLWGSQDPPGNTMTVNWGELNVLSLSLKFQVCEIISNPQINVLSRGLKSMVVEIIWGLVFLCPKIHFSLKMSGGELSIWGL